MASIAILGGNTNRRGTFQVGHLDAPTAAFALKLGSVFLFSLTVLCVKFLGRDYPTGEIIFSRSLFGLVVLAPFFVRAGWRAMMPHKPHYHLLRAGLGLAATCMTFVAIPHLPLATFSTILFTTPLFVAILAFVLLRERLHLSHVLALACGFGGILLAVNPFSETSTLSPFYVGMVLGATLVGSLVTILLRKMTQTETSISIVFWVTFAWLCASGVSLFFGFTLPTFHDLVLLLGIGIFGTLSQLMVTQSYRLAPVSKLMVLEYAGLVFASFYGWMFWGDLPTLAGVVGAVLVILSGLHVARSRAE